MLKYTRLLSVSFIITILILSTSLPYQAAAQKGGPDFIPGRYIVVLEDGVSPQDVFRGKGVVPEFVYSHALNGFAGPLSPVVIGELKQDPRVLYIEQDQMAYTSVQTLPTGIARIDAEPESSPPTSPYAGLVTVAILDTGIDFNHLDLNVVHRADCEKKGGNPFKSVVCRVGEGDDGYGHGTHVAGTVAALNNDIGPVGVVPGADLWAIRVLDNNGSGSYSEVIAGIDYVAANAEFIDVANMSLGGGFSQALNNAVENAIIAGVVFVVAAGNNIDDASNYSPASAPNAITTSAMADFDGKGEGLNDKTIVFSSCTEDKDDSFACFSNYGSVVDIMAPGVSIFSTYKDGGYATFSGTSMASPHVAGAAAKLIAESATSLSPSDVLNTLLANGIKDGDPNYLVIDDDPDNIAEPIVYVGNTSVGDSPIVSITSPADGSTVSGTVIITANASDNDGFVTQVEFFVDGASVGVDNDGFNGWSASWDSTTDSDGTHSISAEATDNDANTSLDNVSVTVDNIDDLPSVSITNPNNGSTVSGTVTITADASDDKGVTQVEFFVDGASVGVDNDGSNGWSASWDSTITADDSTHFISAEATDTIGQTKNDSINVTVNNSSSSSVSVASIEYVTHGGRDNSKHLDIKIALLDDLENPVSGASVSIDLFRGGSFVTSGSGTTGTGGTITFTLNNAASGCYTTIVTDVAAGMTWDGDTPTNQFCK